MIFMLSLSLFVLARLEVVELPSTLALECVVIRLIPIDATIIEVVAFDLILRKIEWHELNRTAYNATF